MEYLVKIDEFEGPLDLLLHLIKESNIDIYDIEISKITKDYMDYINKMEELNINVAASYLVMAAELMEIKSKMLLPKVEEEVENEDEEDVSKEALINKLIEYKKYKDMTGTFKELEYNRSKIFIKSPDKISKYIDNGIKNIDDTSVEDLVNAFKNFLERREREKPLSTKITNKEYSVKDRKNSIKNILREKKNVKFNELFDIDSISYIIVTFLSILELTKDREIILRQDKNFSDIDIMLEENV